MVESHLICCVFLSKNVSQHRRFLYSQLSFCLTKLSFAFCLFDSSCFAVRSVLGSQINRNGHEYKGYVRTRAL